MGDLAGLLCVVTLLAILGGSIMVMIYGVRGVVAMLRQWIDRK